MRVKYKKKSIEIKAFKVDLIGKILGLMFRNRDYENLLFDFGYNGRHVIHSFFVFFDFLAVWLDDENNVIDWKIVKPFDALVQPKKSCRKLIEIPFNKKNKKIWSFFVGKIGKI